MTDTGSKLASSIPNSCNDFTQFIRVSVTVLEENILQDTPLEEAYNNLKSSKSPGFDDISLSIIKFPLKHIFSQSLESCMLPNSLKIARFSPILKKRRTLIY